MRPLKGSRLCVGHLGLLHVNEFVVLCQQGASHGRQLYLVEDGHLGAVEWLAIMVQTLVQLLRSGEVAQQGVGIDRIRYRHLSLYGINTLFNGCLHVIPLEEGIKLCFSLRAS